MEINLSRSCSLEDVILISRKSRTLETYFKLLLDKYQIRKTAAVALVNMPLSQLTDMRLENLKGYLAYYSLAVKQLEPLFALRS